MTIPSSRSLILWISVFSITSPSADFGRLRRNSDFFGTLRTSSGIFGNDRVVFKNLSTPRIKISRLYLRKSWQVQFFYILLSTAHKRCRYILYQKLHPSSILTFQLSIDCCLFSLRKHPFLNGCFRRLLLVKRPCCLKSINIGHLGTDEAQISMKDSKQEPVTPARRGASNFHYSCPRLLSRRFHRPVHFPDFQNREFLNLSSLTNQSAKPNDVQFSFPPHRFHFLMRSSTVQTPGVQNFAEKVL